MDLQRNSGTFRLISTSPTGLFKLLVLLQNINDVTGALSTTKSTSLALIMMPCSLKYAGRTRISLELHAMLVSIPTLAWVSSLCFLDDEMSS